MSCPPPPLILLPTNQTTTGQVRQRRNLTVTQCNIDMLSPSTLAPRNYSCHDTVASIQPSRQIRHCDADFDGRPIPRAGYVHQLHRIPLGSDMALFVHTRL